MKERQFPLRIKTCFRGHELENGQLVQRKAMALRHKTKLPFAFREGDIKACLPAANAFQQELQRKGGLSGAGLPLDQIQPFRVNTTAQDVVQPWNASRNPLLDVCCKVLLIHRGDGLLRILPISARNTPIRSSASSALPSWALFYSHAGQKIPAASRSCGD